jgi:hypothetical protein
MKKYVGNWIRSAQHHTCIYEKQIYIPDYLKKTVYVIRTNNITSQFIQYMGHDYLPFYTFFSVFSLFNEVR